MPDDLPPASATGVPAEFASVDLKNAAEVTPQESPVFPTADSISAITEVTPEDALTLAIRGATEVTPEGVPVSAKKLPPLDQAGVDLAVRVLWMISVFVVITVVWVWWSEHLFFKHFSQLSGTMIQVGTNQPAVSKDILEPVIKARSDFREFWLKLFQMVLLNVLLPVLTALLGYVFGSRRTQEDTNKK